MPGSPKPGIRTSAMVLVRSGSAGQKEVELVGWQRFHRGLRFVAGAHLTSDKVDPKARENNNHAKNQGINSQNGLVFALHHREQQQSQWENTAADGPGHASRHAEPSAKLGLANPQRYQRYEL